MENRNEINIEDILSDKPSEDHFLELPLTNKVFKIFSGVVIVVFLIILFQFLNISVFNHQIYERSAFGNMAESEIKPAPRGLIKDRFGNVIVGNKASFQVFLSPKEFPESSEKREKVLAKVSNILEIDSNKLLEKIKGHDWRLGNLLLERNINHNKLVKLSSLELPGIKIEPGFTRVAAASKAFSHLVGYTGLVSKEELEENPKLIFKDKIGKSGLELQYDKKLRGRSGKEIAYINAQSEIKEKRTVSEPEKGENLNLFIDGEFQKYFYNRLLKRVKNIGGGGGVGLAVNPQNGEVLSLVSIPGFKISSPSDYFNQPNKPFFNRAVSGLYHPGSTVKPLHGIAALEEGIVTPQKEFLSTGRLVVPNPYNPDQPSIFKDWKAHGWVDLYSALARSSNVYFYTIGGGYKNQEGLGISRLNKWWKVFNLNKKTKIDLPREKTGSLPNPEKHEGLWRVGNTYNVSIGQGKLLVTPLELLNYISAIANGGEINKLRVAKTQKPEVLKDISGKIEKALPHVRKGMKDVVDKPYGTAHYLANLPVEIAAKTGTAQVGNGKTNALFTGFAPYKNPELAIMILIENAQEEGFNTLPVAKDVFSWYYSHRME